jgi:very-short-patch-repair endonuclease
MGVYMDNKEMDKVIDGSVSKGDSSVSSDSPNSKVELNSRIKIWKEKLLDLSLRNRLLNYRETKKSISIQCGNLMTLEDSLSGGEPFEIRSIHEDPLNNPNNGDKINSLVEAQNRHQLFSPLVEDKLNRSLKEMARAARVGLEEGGANTLFLGIGFLKWVESEGNKTQRVAPLILLPVSLIRESARKKYKVRKFHEETRVNISLLEKLRIDFAIDLSKLADPPVDDSGLDVKQILNEFSQAVKHMDGWEVVDECCLGLFSFTKFLMWRDLNERTDKLLSSDVVRHLALNSRDSYPDQGEFPQTKDLDSAILPADIHCPLDSDSSQLVAILAAGEGKSFVLEGPPGTGKSQTITNLITHCLSIGKTVLFVSEKMAALEVVKKRLEKVGMGPFCLELHSNKARKRDVLEDLARTLRVQRVTPPDNWDQISKEVEDKRERLNQYVIELHKKRGAELTYFDALSGLMGLEDTYRLKIDFGNDSNKPGVKILEKYKDLLDEFTAKAKEIGEVSNHPFKESSLENWSRSLDLDVKQILEKINHSIIDVKNNGDKVFGIFNHGSNTHDKYEISIAFQLSTLFMEEKLVTRELILSSGWNGTKNRLEEFVNDDKRIDQLSTRLDPLYEKEVFELDLEAIQKRVEFWSKQFFLFAFFALFFLRISLKKLCKKRLPKNRDLAKELSDAKELFEKRKVVKEIIPEVRILLGDWEDDPVLRWEKITETIRWTGAFRSALSSWLTRPEISKESSKHKDHLINLAASIDGALPPFIQYKNQFQNFCKTYEILSSDLKKLEEMLHLTGVDYGSVSGEDYFDLLKEKIEQWINGLAGLREWTLYLSAMKKLNNSPLESISQHFFQGKIKHNEIISVFQSAYYTWFVDRVATEVPLLGYFHSSDHERIRNQFKEADLEHDRIVQQLVQSTLGSNIPMASQNDPVSSGIGILKRELKKKSRHKPLRKLFKEISSLILRLKPCMLMSPLSLAQYLNRDFPLFDIVVFDEASQIPVHDSMGAISRGKQLIVVGDSKQLPPTSFFSRGESDDVANFDDDDIIELESILDECIAAGLPRLVLKWHYRSRHENLIAFSNYHYYQNELFTFPSQREKHSQLGVEWRYIEDGVYDKGKTRSNKKEAESVVKEVVRRLQDKVERGRSIGIVTFSKAQQQLIEDLLDDARKENPDIEKYFGHRVMEPLFIKNLENVQGDERDVMLFSVCYGPDMDGKVSMNFGPLNREGGERRLNVAITRAREKMIVFSTLKKDHIDLRRTDAVGARDLRKFLEYSEKGPTVLKKSVSTGGKGESLFEKDVYETLLNKGLIVEQNVGCSGYRVDLGIVDSDVKGSYLLGIECDGEYYRSAKTARDRDRLRSQVLEGLGWRLHRIWSTDWQQDRKKELLKIESLLETAKIENKKEYLSVNGANDSSISESSPQKPMEESGDTEKWLNELPLLSSIGVPYKIYGVSQIRFLDSDDIYKGTMAEVLTKEIINTVLTESPIHERLLVHRVSDVFHIKRITKKVLGFVERQIGNYDGKIKIEKHGDFYWRSDHRNGYFDEIRSPKGDKECERIIDEIPMEELVNGIRKIIGIYFSINRSDLAKEIAGIIGMERVGQKIKESVDEGIGQMIINGECRVEDDKIFRAILSKT